VVPLHGLAAGDGEVVFSSWLTRWTWLWKRMLAPLADIDFLV